MGRKGMEGREGYGKGKGGKGEGGSGMGRGESLREGSTWTAEFLVTPLLPFRPTTLMH